jgi:hypothetical protein
MSESRSRPVKLHPQDKTVIDRLGGTRLALMRVGVAYLARLDRDTVGQLVDEQKADPPRWRRDGPNTHNVWSRRV